MDATDWFMTFPVGVVIFLGELVYGIVALATKHISPADFLAAVTAGGGLLAIGHGVHHVATVSVSVRGDARAGGGLGSRRATRTPSELREP